MADDTKKPHQTQLWNIANTLRGKMGADEFRDYLFGFISYKSRIELFDQAGFDAKKSLPRLWKPSTRGIHRED